MMPLLASPTGWTWTNNTGVVVVAPDRDRRRRWVATEMIFIAFMLGWPLG